MKLTTFALALCLCACIATTSDLARVTEQLEDSKKAQAVLVARFEARMAELADLYESGVVAPAEVAAAIRDQSQAVSAVLQQTAAKDVAVAQDVQQQRTDAGLGWWDLIAVVVLGQAATEFLRHRAQRKVA